MSAAVVVVVIFCVCGAVCGRAFAVRPLMDGNGRVAVLHFRGAFIRSGELSLSLTSTDSAQSLSVLSSVPSAAVLPVYKLSKLTASFTCHGHSDPSASINIKLGNAPICLAR